MYILYHIYNSRMVVSFKRSLCKLLHEKMLSFNGGNIPIDGKRINRK